MQAGGTSGVVGVVVGVVGDVGVKGVGVGFVIVLCGIQVSHAERVLHGNPPVGEDGEE